MKKISMVLVALIAVASSSFSQTIEMSYAAQIQVSNPFEIYPSDIRFGDCKRGLYYIQKTYIVNNSENAMQVTRLELKNCGKDGFKVLTSELPFTMQPYEWKTVLVEYTAPKDGKYIDSIGVGSSDSFSYQKEVSATTYSPIINVSNVNFGKVKIGESASASIEVSNTGEAKLILKSYSIEYVKKEGINQYTVFYTTDTNIRMIQYGQTIIPAHSSVVYTMNFAPREAQRYKAMLTFASDANSEDSVCVMEGEGVRSDVSEVESVSEYVGAQFVVVYDLSGIVVVPNANSLEEALSNLRSGYYLVSMSGTHDVKKIAVVK